MERAIYDRLREIEQDHWWFEGRRAVLTSEIERLSLPADARVLEVGCGAGGNLAMLRRFGEVSAVEPDGPSREYAAGRGLAEVRGGLLPDGLPDFGGPFDLVCAFDVVEHVDDDAGAVRAMAAQLRTGGRLVITVPAYAWMWSAHDAAHHHKRRYVRPEVRNLIQAAGLKVRRVTHFNTLLFPPIAAIRLAKAALKRDGGDDEALPPPALNRLLASMFAAERGLLRAVDLPFGVSILAVAERPA
ncbi:class I SAM-dependent methyltransferase [Phenylobacterium sp. J426]|uniref:class I SAM-dependent methyltransferase n=1 Tax=Phenylobacterium sp. J426 TaxID=2898439 RepID=UPI0021513E20|nr:class I SAM-dependent methyltransferase [Phenylobacterium sp. J426]MCR5873072.1 class I SAM-dependent methyltransferase [Phenylobacterium sp. J426]